MSICTRCRAHAAERSRYPAERRRCVTCGYVEYTPARSTATAAQVKGGRPAAKRRSFTPATPPSNGRAAAEYQLAMALFG